MKNLKYYTFIIAIAIVSCKQKDQKSAQLPIEKTVDSLHNEAMAVGEVAMKTKFKLDSVLANRRITKNADSLAVKRLVENLEHADEKMMDWMHNFTPDLKATTAEKQNYYTGQLDSLTQVQNGLKESINEANKFLKKPTN